MKRRDFLAAAGAYATLHAVPAAAAIDDTRATTAPAVHARRGQADLILRGGTVYDGMGGPPIDADVVVSGGRIAAVERNASRAGAVEIDARGHAVAPGFIDIHSHTDLSLLSSPRAESKVRQGVTTEVAGQDGGSVAPSGADRVAAMRREYGDDVDLARLAGFFAAVTRRGAAVNSASMVGLGTVRGLVVGNADRPATEAELRTMTRHVADALADGASGASSGLEYTPGGFASLDELIGLARPLRGTGLPYASHMRNEDDQLLAAIEEAINVGRLAGAAVNISHLKAQGGRNWWKAVPALEVIEAAQADGTDVGFDVYPYIAYSTGLSNLFPLWSRDGGTDAFLARLRDPAQVPRIEAYVRDKIDELGSWDAVQITSTGAAASFAQGKRLGTLAQERGVEPFALLLRIMIDDRARPGMVGFGMSEDNVERFLAHPLSVICSDAPARTATANGAGTSHPRAFGSYPRVLGHYVRDRRIMPLETAIMKMTSAPAARLKFADRGRIAAGLAADLVVFDPDTVADRATFETPHLYPVGILHVIVNGVPVISAGEHTGATPGTAVKPTP
jgi:N-acyl-D-amino-acid deacylase